MTRHGGENNGSELLCVSSSDRSSATTMVRCRMKWRLLRSGHIRSSNGVCIVVAGSKGVRINCREPVLK